MIYLHPKFVKSSVNSFETSQCQYHSVKQLKLLEYLVWLLNLDFTCKYRNLESIFDIGLFSIQLFPSFYPFEQQGILPETCIALCFWYPVKFGRNLKKNAFLEQEYFYVKNTIQFSGNV